MLYTHVSSFGDLNQFLRCHRGVAKVMSKLDFHSMNVSHTSIDIFILPINTLVFFFYFPPMSSSSPTPDLTFYPMYVCVCAESEHVRATG